MNEVLTPDGWGQVLRSDTTRGRTSYLVKGAGFEGWYDGLQVEADFADQPEDVVPNDANSTTLPYPSRPQGPGWDGTTSTIQPDIDPHLEMGGASDSLTGEPSSEDPVGADMDGLFEPHSRISRARHHHVAMDDPILDVSALPGESPTGLENSPINPDGVSTDDLFDGDNGFGRAASYDRLVIEDDMSFLRYAADDDDEKKKHHREQGQGQVGYPKDSDNDADGDDDPDDDDSDDSSSGDDGSGGGDSDGGDGDSGGGDGGGHTAAVLAALSTTADLHFLANLCSCASSGLPLHSQSEHRELEVEAAKKRKKGKPLGSKPLTGQHDDNHGPRTPGEAGYNRGAKAIGDLTTPKKKGTKSKRVERPIKYAEVDGVTPQAQDLDKLLERYEQDNFNYQESNLRNLVDRSGDDDDNTGNLNNYASVQHTADGYEKYIGSNGDGTYHLIASGGGKLAKGEQYGHYDSHQDAHDAVEAIIARNHSKTAAPAAADPNAQPTQIESQIEQLMQFWAVDNNGWWHWTGSQSDLALLNQMQQQMMAVGMPGGPPGQMQAQSAVELAEGFQVESNTPAPWRDYLQTIASDRLVALAAWADVVQKSKRLRSEGAIDLEVFKPEVITAYVQGDHGRYYTTVQRLGSVGPGIGRQLTSTQVSGWSCECDWGHWAWIRKRSFVGRMCSHAYALFSEMRSLDAKKRRGVGNGKPVGGGQTLAGVGNKVSWVRNAQGGFDWVTTDPTLPTAAIARTASGWGAQVWSDGTAEDSLDLGVFKNSGWAQRAAGRIITAHLAAAGDVDMVGGSFAPGENTSYDSDPYAADGAQEPILSEEEEAAASTPGAGPGIQEGTTRVGAYTFASLFAEAEAKDGDDDEGPEQTDDGIEEEEPDDDESLDEEIAEDEGDSDDGSEDEDDDEPEPADDDGGHDEPHQRDDSDDEDEGEGTDNPGDDSDDDHVEKTSSVAELQAKFGLSHLAGANYSLAEQDKLVREGDGKTARNRTDLNLTGTHYEAAAGSAQSPEDTLAFLF